MIATLQKGMRALKGPAHRFDEDLSNALRYTGFA